MTTPCNSVTIGLLQHAAGPQDSYEVVMARVETLAREAAARGAQIIATQELFSGSYFCQVEDSARMDLAESIPGPTTERLGKLARELNVEITASLFERRAAGIYHNTSVYLDATGAIIGKYRKMHIPDDPRFYEKYYFTPGDLGFQAVQGRHAKSGMLVCWDQWYHGETPEDARQQRDAWITMHRAHAIANGCFVAAINRIGTEDDLKFWGTSMVIDPSGEIVAEASTDEPCVLTYTCNLARIEEIRRGWPFFRDRRIDAFGGLLQRFGADA